jgi:hypothetical protein
MGSGATTVVDLLEVGIVDPVIEIKLEAAVEIEVVGDAIDVEVILWPGQISIVIAATPRVWCCV